MNYSKIIPLISCLILTCFISIKSEFYSQSDVQQDKFLYENFFKNMQKSEGFFVEIGAHDGITGSNTYFYEKELGWQGICFEPQKKYFDRLIKDRNCLCINACVAATNGEVEFVECEGYTNALSGMTNTYDPRHWQRMQHEINLFGGSYKIVKMPSVRLNDILDQYGIKTIHYLSIDTEGSELEILKSIDFDKVTIYALSVENNYQTPAIREFLESKGFLFYIFLGGLDEIYINPKFSY